MLILSGGGLGTLHHGAEAHGRLGVHTASNSQAAPVAANIRERELVGVHPLVIDSEGSILSTNRCPEVRTRVGELHAKTCSSAAHSEHL